MVKRKFQRKPSIIEAWQYKGEFVEGMCLCSGSPHLHTMHADQLVYLTHGDWITKEPKGDGYYPIKPEALVELYECAHA